MADWKPEADSDSDEKSRLTHARRAEIMASLASDFPEGAIFEAHDVLNRYPELQSIERVYYFLSTGVSSGKIHKTAHRAYTMAPEIQIATEYAHLPSPGEARKKLSLEDRINIFRLIADTYPSPNEFTVQDVINLDLGIEQKTQINNLLSAAITRKEVIRLGGGKFSFDPAKQHIYRDQEEATRRPAADQEIQPAAARPAERKPAAPTPAPVAQPPAQSISPLPAPPEPITHQQPEAGLSPARPRDLEPRDLAHLQVLTGFGYAYAHGECFSKGDFLRPTHRFRAEVYGDRYPLDLEQELYPLCLVLGEIEPNPGSEDADPLPYDIFVAFVDDRGQVHTKLAGSWQFKRVERKN